MRKPGDYLQDINFSSLTHKKEQRYETFHERHVEIRNCNLTPFENFQPRPRIIWAIYSCYNCREYF